MFDYYCWDPGSSMIKTMELLNIGSKKTSLSFSGSRIFLVYLNQLVYTFKLSLILSTLFLVGK